VEYSHFSVGSESTKYTATVSGFNNDSTASDNFIGLNDLNGIKFSTKDKDNDSSDRVHCASKYTGGWWDRKCGSIHPTGLYGNPTGFDSDYMYWDTYAFNAQSTAFFVKSVKLTLVPIKN